MLSVGEFFWVCGTGFVLNVGQIVVVCVSEFVLCVGGCGVC